MANVRWRGGAPARAEVQSFTIGGTWANTETITATIGSRTITVTLSTAAAATTTTVAAALVAAWNGAAVTNGETRDFTGDQFYEMNEITASNSTNTFILTHDTAGVPFTATLGEGSASGTVSAATITTAAKGPYDWNTAANWSGGSVPVNSDNVFIEGMDENFDILYGLDQSAVSLTSLTIHSSYTGRVGLDSLRNRDAATEYAEYRRIALKLGGTPNVYIGAGDGDGSPRIRIEQGASAGVFHIYSTGSSTVDGHPAVFISGGTSAVASVYGGSVWFGAEGGDSLNLTSLKVAGTEDDVAEVLIGHNGNGTCGSITASNCILTVDCGASAISAFSGAEIFIFSAQSTGSLTLKDGAVARPRGVNKAFTSIAVWDLGHYDATGYGGDTTATTFTVYAGGTATFPDGSNPPGTITIPVGVGLAGRDRGSALATLNLPLQSSVVIDWT